MTEYFAAGFLAFIQGLTEFLPISSSSHLIIVPHFLGWQDQGLAFDIAIHVGTLVASVSYFHRDIKKILTGCYLHLTGKGYSSDASLGWGLAIATLPIFVAGFVLHDVVENELRSITVIGFTTLGFGLLLWFADVFKRGQRSVNSLRIKDVVLIGLGQVFALIPGTSRSGVTLTVCLLLGMNRQDASRFSFMLAIPVISMAGIWQFLTLLGSEQETNWILFGYATAISAVVAYLCIHYFLKTIEKIGMLPFVIYRILLAILIFTVL